MQIRLCYDDQLLFVPKQACAIGEAQYTLVQEDAIINRSLAAERGATHYTTLCTKGWQVPIRAKYAFCNDSSPKSHGLRDGYKSILPYAKIASSAARYDAPLDFGQFIPKNGSFLHFLPMIFEQNARK